LVGLFTNGCAAVHKHEPPAVEVGSADGQLIVLVQTGASRIDRQFQQTHLPKIKALADELDVPLRVVDAAPAAPAQVTLTPLIVFQNHRGRSVYQGRYTTLDRVRTFVRTARFAPQGNARLIRENIPVWRVGRAKIVAPLKIGHVTGAAPKAYDHDAFERDATAAILSAFDRFKPSERVELRRSDRLFYMDFYPWLDESGELYLSVKLFSQFHCHKPIYTHHDEPFRGPWKRREEVFASAAAAMEQAVVDAMRASRLGDGVDPIRASTPLVTWESLGLPLPPAPATAARVADAPPLARSWRLAEPQPNDPPRIQFRFAAPLDGYAGETTSVRGRLELGQDLSVAEMRGEFVADVASVTMGEPDLDESLMGELYLNAARYAASRFTIRSVTATDAPLRYGDTVQAVLSGDFELKGKTVPLSVRTLLEPTVADDGEPRLIMQSSFQLDLRAFDLEGPPGPASAMNTLLFDLHFVLEPRNQSG